MNRFPLYALALVAASLTFSACGDDDDNNNAPPAADIGYYFKGNVDGQAVSFVDGQNNYISNAYISSGTGGAQELLSLGMEYKPLGLDNNSAYVMVDAAFNDEPTPAQQAAIWHTGTYTYTPSGGNTGASITYVDAAENHWSTNNGSGDQTGSTFTVTEVSNYSDPVFGDGKTVKGTFSCKVYNGTGESKTITNGSFRGVILHD